MTPLRYSLIVMETVAEQLLCYGIDYCDQALLYTNLPYHCHNLC
jgi:hypothetical protein